MIFFGRVELICRADSADRACADASVKQDLPLKGTGIQREHALIRHDNKSGEVTIELPPAVKSKTFVNGERTMGSPRLRVCV